MADLIPWAFLLPPALVVLVVGLTMILKRTPAGRAGALLRLGGAHMNRKEFDEAERCFRQGLELVPEHQPLTAMLATLLVAVDRYDEADPLAKKAHEANPADHGMLIVRGQCAFGNDQKAEALTLWEKVPEASDHFAIARTLMAKAHEDLGQIDEALDALGRAIARSAVHEARPLKAERKRLESLAGQPPAQNAVPEPRDTETKSEDVAPEDEADSSASEADKDESES